MMKRAELQCLSVTQATGSWLRGHLCVQVCDQVCVFRCVRLTSVQNLSGGFPQVIPGGSTLICITSFMLVGGG